MNMKDHILAALKEQFDSWEELLAKLSEEQVTSPQFDLDWSIKDVMAHLWAWQQISIARMEGGVEDREPEFPKWIVNNIENWEDDSGKVNALTFELYRLKVWSEVYQNWKNGYLRLIELGNQISERNLINGDIYS